MIANPGSAEVFTLTDILMSQAITDVKQMMILTKVIASLLKNLHTDELIMADLDASSVNIRNWGQVCVYSPPLLGECNTTGYFKLF